MQNTGIIKRTFIVLIFIAIIGAIWFLGYLIFSPAATCSDKKQNQAEKGIDCGGTCAPCEAMIEKKDVVIDEVAVALGGNNTYDVVGKISNPNDIFGTGLLEYTFTLKDAGSNVIATRTGKNFVLPADAKYLAEFGIQSEGGAIPTSAELVINEVKWEKLNNIGKPQIGVYNKNFKEELNGTGSVVDGVIRNESGFDLGKIFITVILRSENGDIVGVSKTEKSSVRTKEERDFHLTWPYQLSGSVQSMEVDAQSNVFDTGNFSF